jgi:2-polyprenyl-6-methoxyphenol hydroxylase-like FAD-dependent oxidoreductase
MTQRHAEVIGAGLAGLTVAAVLAQLGWSVRVHERTEELREIGAGIYLWENALRALEVVGAYDAVASRGERILDTQLRDHRHRVLQREWLRCGRLYTVLRSDLHQALANAAVTAGVEIVTSSEVLAASPGGKIRLKGGTVLSADLVVGADGVNSRVRKSLGLTRSVVDLKDGCGRHLIPRTSDDPVNTTFEEWSGGRRMGVVPCSERWTYIFLCCPESDAEGVRQQPFSALEWLKTYPNFHSQLDRIAQDTQGRWARFFDVEPRAWHSGRVAIIGDAAHAMSPNLGQAACVAMTNAIALGDTLERYGVDEALPRWEDSERAVTERVQRYSRVYGWLGTHCPPTLLDARSALVWAVGRSKRAQRRINYGAAYFPARDQTTAPVTTDKTKNAGL